MGKIHVKRIKLEFFNDSAIVDIEEEIRSENSRLNHTYPNHSVKAFGTTMSDSHLIISFELTEKK